MYLRFDVAHTHTQFPNLNSFYSNEIKRIRFHKDVKRRLPSSFLNHPSCKCAHFAIKAFSGAMFCEASSGQKPLSKDQRSKVQIICIWFVKQRIPQHNLTVVVSDWCYLYYLRRLRNFCNLASATGE